MLTVIWWKWKSHQGFRSTHTLAHVNAAYRGFAQNFDKPFEGVCITDDPEGLDPAIRYVPLWNDHADIMNPHGAREPACYRRLKLFDAETARQIGDRLLWLDLDMIFTGNVTPLFDRPEPIVLLPTEHPSIPFNGSMLMMNAGARPDVWSSFDPQTSPARNRKAGCYGSDQGHISYCLRNRGEATWRVGPGGDGIWFFGRHLKKEPWEGRLPPDARLVSFHGKPDPWDEEAMRLDWVRRHYGVHLNRQAAAA